MMFPISALKTEAAATTANPQLEALERRLEGELTKF